MIFLPYLYLGMDKRIASKSIFIIEGPQAPRIAKNVHCHIVAKIGKAGICIRLLQSFACILIVVRG